MPVFGWIRDALGIGKDIVETKKSKLEIDKLEDEKRVRELITKVTLEDVKVYDSKVKRLLKEIKKTHIIIALVATLTGFIATLISIPEVRDWIGWAQHSHSRKITARVEDEITGNGIEGALVYLESSGGFSILTSTESGGIFSFSLRQRVDVVRIQVRAEGYEPFAGTLDVDGESNRTTIRLRPKQMTIVVEKGIKLVSLNYPAPKYLVISLDSIMVKGKPSEYRIGGTLSSPGYAPLKFQGTGVGDRLTYREGLFYVEILNIDRHSATFRIWPLP